MPRLTRVLAVAVVCAVAVPVAQAEPVAPPALGARPVLAPTVVAGSTAPAPTSSGVEAAVASSLSSSAWGSVSAMVLDPATGTVLLDRRGTQPGTPASTLKVLTGLTALTALGPETRLATRALLSGSTVNLVGGGDSSLTRRGEVVNGVRTASLLDLAKRTAAALIDQGISSVRVTYDDSLFTGPRVSPAWSPVLISSGAVGPVSALEVDQGREASGSDSRVGSPAAFAAAYFATQLRAEGITVAQGIDRAAAASDATEVGTVWSPTVLELVERTLTLSDNDLAEALAHLSGGRLGGEASFAGGVAATQKVMAAYGIPADGMSLSDGSGLARSDRLEPQSLTRAWQAIVTSAAPQGLETTAPVGMPVATGVPIAGFTGTLATRFDTAGTSAGRGVVRAKTGTLTGVVSLSGIVRDRSGRLLAFAAFASGVTSREDAQAALDRFAAAVAGCGCG